MSLRSWIKEQGLTQAEIARRSGVHKSLVCECIAGRRTSQRLRDWLYEHGYENQLEVDWEAIGWHYKAGASLRECAKISGTDKSTVQRHLRQIGVKMRGQSTAGGDYHTKHPTCGRYWDPWAEGDILCPPEVSSNSILMNPLG